MNLLANFSAPHIFLSNFAKVKAKKQSVRTATQVDARVLAAAHWKWSRRGITIDKTWAPCYSQENNFHCTFLLLFPCICTHWKRVQIVNHKKKKLYTRFARTTQKSEHISYAMSFRCMCEWICSSSTHTHTATVKRTQTSTTWITFTLSISVTPFGFQSISGVNNKTTFDNNYFFLSLLFAKIS